MFTMHNDTGPYTEHHKLQEGIRYEQFAIFCYMRLVWSFLVSVLHVIRFSLCIVITAMDSLPKQTIYVKNIYEKIGKQGRHLILHIFKADADRWKL